jgi:hypothetical protein
MTVIGIFARFCGAYSFTQPASATFEMGIAGAFWHAVGSAWPLFLLGWLATEVTCVNLALARVQTSWKKTVVDRGPCPDMLASSNV